MVELLRGKGVETVLYAVSLVVAAFRFVKIAYLVVVKIEPLLGEVETYLKTLGKR